jgi:hypothetical protein
MPVSIERSFVFVHIPKTGGTSIEEALRGCAIKLALLGMSTREQRDKLGITETWLHHIPAIDLRRILGASAWDRYFKFAFVRNPWDRLVSLYHFVHRQFATRPDFRQAWPEIAARLSTTQNLGEWLRAGAFPTPQIDLIAGSDGGLLVDFVGRFEHIERDFDHVAQRIGVKAALPHLLRSDHRPYRDYYDRGTRDLVAQHYRGDIETFGYEF